MDDAVVHAQKYRTLATPTHFYGISKNVFSVPLSLSVCPSVRLPNHSFVGKNRDIPHKFVKEF